VPVQPHTARPGHEAPLRAVGRWTRLVTVGTLALAAGLGVALSGCSSENGKVSCNLNSCTVTLNRGVDAKVSVLGAEVKLVAADNNQVTLDVAGNRIDLPVGGEPQAAGGLTVRVQKVTTDHVVVEIRRA
jgi:hypothetical protein